LIPKQNHKKKHVLIYFNTFNWPRNYAIWNISL